MSFSFIFDLITTWFSFCMVIYISCFAFFYGIVDLKTKSYEGGNAAHLWLFMFTELTKTPSSLKRTNYFKYGGKPAIYFFRMICCIQARTAYICIVLTIVEVMSH
jgi:hypothetical protein